MSETGDNEAAEPNRALQPLHASVGTWTTVATHPLVPGKTFQGRTSPAGNRRGTASAGSRISR